LVTLDRDSLGSVATVLRDTIQSKQAILDKLLKDAPSQDIEFKSMAELRSSYVVRIQGRVDNEAKGAAKAIERKDFRHARVKEFIAQFTLLDKHFTELEAMNTKKHDEKNKAAAEQDAKILSLFDAKIAKLSPPAHAGNGAAASTSYQYAMPPSAQPQTSTVLALDDAAAEQASLKDLEDAQQRAAAAVANAEAARLVLEKRMATVRAQFEKTFELDPAELPQTTIPEDGLKLAALGSIYRATSAWGLGPMAPFQWDALDTEAGPGFEAVQVSKEVIGRMWALWYPEADPKREDVVPRQLVQLISHCLTQVKQKFEDEQAKMAIDALAPRMQHALRESSKRLRSE